MEFDAYLDESGDLGWSLNRPFRHGGSSQFFTIAYLILPTAKNKFINRYIRQFNKKRGSHKELKGASFSNGRAKVVSREIMRLMNWHEDMVLGAVTVRKANVPNQLVNTGNDDILYNYMVQVSVCPKLLKCTKVNIIPDKRSVPAGSQNSCSDLIKNEMWLQRNCDVEIDYLPQESHSNERLIFIDWIANFIWRNYEDGHGEAYRILGKRLQENTLFF